MDRQFHIDVQGTSRCILCSFNCRTPFVSTDPCTWHWSPSSAIAEVTSDRSRRFGIELERVSPSVSRWESGDPHMDWLIGGTRDRRTNMSMNRMRWRGVGLTSSRGSFKVADDGSLKGCNQVCRSLDNLRNGNGLRNAIIIYLDSTSTWLATVRRHCSLSLSPGCKLEIWFCMHDHFIRAKGDFEIESKTLLLSYSEEMLHLFDWRNKPLKNWQISVEIYAR